jgi:hypothetical protein
MTSRMVTLVKVNDAALQVSDILGITVCFKFINFTFRIFPPFVREMSASFASYFVEITYLHHFGSDPVTTAI